MSQPDSTRYSEDMPTKRRAVNPATIIVEIAQDGAARVRECPPGVVVMLVESRERPEEDPSPTSTQRKRCIGAGRRDGSQSEQVPQQRENVEIHEIPVEFPG